MRILVQGTRGQTERFEFAASSTSGFPVHTKTYSVVNEVELSLTATIDIYLTQKGKLSRNDAIVSQFFWRCDRGHALILILMITLFYKALISQGEI